MILLFDFELIIMVLVFSILLFCGIYGVMVELCCGVGLLNFVYLNCVYSGFWFCLLVML